MKQTLIVYRIGHKQLNVVYGRWMHWRHKLFIAPGRFSSRLAMLDGVSVSKARGYVAYVLKDTYVRYRRILFLPRDAMHKRGLCRHAVSVCLFVCHVRELCENE